MRKVIRVIALASETLAVAALVLLFCWLLTGIVAREAFDQGLPHLLEVSASLMVVMAFLGLGRATTRGENLRFDWVVNALRGRLAGRVVHVVAEVVTTVVIALWAYAATQTALDAFVDEQGPRYGAGLDTWPAKASVAMGLAVALLVLLARTARLLLGRVESTSDDPRPADAASRAAEPPAPGVAVESRQAQELRT